MKTIVKEYFHPEMSLMLQEKFPRNSEGLMLIGEIYKGMYNCHPSSLNGVIFLYQHSAGTTVLAEHDSVKIIGNKKNVLRTKRSLEEECEVNFKKIELG
jgi:hypothetical protein